MEWSMRPTGEAETLAHRSRMQPRTFRNLRRKNRSFGGAQHTEIFVGTAAADGLGKFVRPRRGPRAGARVPYVTRRALSL